MAGRSRFLDDMHPRSFPKEKRPLFKAPTFVPKPTLPGVSMIDDKNKPMKTAPKKSFLKWRQQHEALFKPIKVEVIEKNDSLVNRRRMVPVQDTPVVHPKFDLDFRKPAPVQVQNQDKSQQCKNDCWKNKIICPSNVKKPQFQSMTTISRLNRDARSEALRFDVPMEGQHNPNHQRICQSDTCGCRCLTVAPSLRNANPIQSLKNDREGTESDLQIAEPSKENDDKTKRLLTKAALVNIFEEQIEIVKQQKQILMRQNEIYNLQYQIEKLLLLSNVLNNGSPIKQLQSSPNRMSIATSPCPLPIENGTEDCSTPTRQNGAMTSFQGNKNEVWQPNHNNNLEMENDSTKDTMLERINKIIKNSPPMINCRLSNGNNCRISPKRTDINISSQTLIYKTSTRNNISMNDPKLADRSFALHLLDMKYHPEAPTTSNANPQNDATEMVKRPPSKSTENDFVHSNISPDKYDYLIRHGLLKK